MNDTSKVALITGGTSGIGRETALKLARNGYIVYVSTRDLDKPAVNEIKEIAKNENLKIDVLYLNLTQSDSIKSAVDTIIKNEGKIDLLINNAAVGYFSAVEDIDIQEFLFQFEVNVAGVIETIQQVIPHMRKQKNGKIINISSILGFSTVPLNAPYSTSKYAIESISETLALELKPFGIDVVIVQPGDFHSSFIKNAKHASYDENSPYYQLYKRKDDKMNSGTAIGRSPEVFADKMLQICESENPKLRYMVGREVLIKKLLHTILIDKLWIKFLSRFYNW